jgi:hypothetical protein
MLSIKSLVDGNDNIVIADTEYVKRGWHLGLDTDSFRLFNDIVRHIRVSDRYKDVIDTFDVPDGETPSGFKIEYEMEDYHTLILDLVRNIGYDRNGKKKPTNLLFSADTANPYEVAEIKNLVSNLTCNPGIIYDLFINNPKANIGNEYRTRNEVMEAIGNTLGPGCDISVEINNPFDDIEKILDEIAEFREMLTKYRVVIKVPHTGPVNRNNYKTLLEGNKQFPIQYNKGTTKDNLRGHNLACRLHEEGYRVNFTLMFEPYQGAMALQARPYFINSFIRHRLKETTYMESLIESYHVYGDQHYIEDLRTYMIQKDYLPSYAIEEDLLKVLDEGKRIIKYRNIDNEEGSDGLDAARHNLRLLKNTNLVDTRLIICSMQGPSNYPDIDKMLTEPEFICMNDRVVITAPPDYLARFTSTNQVIAYNRRFLNAVNNGVK